MKKILIFLIVLFIVIGQITPIYAITQKPEIVGPTAVLMDFTTGQVLYDKNMHKRMYPASTTKILTAIIAIERGNLNDIVTASDNVTKIDGNSIYLSPGEKLTLEQLLYAIMLESANDAAIAIAEYIGGSVENFAKIMNEKAKEIGAHDSHFVNPNGLPDENHYSTPYDMALIARYAMQNPEFRKIVTTIHYQIPPTNKFEKVRDLWLSNRLIKPSSFHYEGADGVKTGYTVAAGQVLVASATRNGHRLISVIMGDQGTNIWTDTIKLLDYGFQNFTLVKKTEKGEVVTYIDLGKSHFKLPLIAKEDFYYEVPKGQENSIEAQIILNKNIKAPINKGETLGYIKYTLNEKEIGTNPLIAAESVYKNFWGNYYKDVQSSEVKNTMYTNPVRFITGTAILGIAFILWRRRKIRNRKKYIFSKY
ncbi:D-alanyl-D-alanine carboxypeptidase (penicillin-binding protein 5/6) [Thermoanaerobacter uzonensis DSM 18761]|jgi:D-alanyl-D-alanine carboxypeptidase (penicillin-binding protein 5/6)|uniref:serine-type D-Ala-D-Ala carboxypeptidase n=1 Tax=Thermoanaerobacter uzonensis DSM 18761 TaxID=1123369 RepID=A0A1M4Z7Z5_9THEO|nr:D-alanyl-D-alanine carboxypeptidase family protein [Thermoanaerobacter uzonensis]SHF13872.1 D-alanyl-D-alanine carboxypeptidase (penicillin-binding protein 5/6) [Thermoanaerobacter uzonensis DSM 18761]